MKKTYESTGIDVVYTYDNPRTGCNGKGRLYSIDNGDVKLTYNCYDTMGRVLSFSKTIDGQTWTTESTYDYAGKVTSITYPKQSGSEADFTVAYDYYPGTDLIESVYKKDGPQLVQIPEYGLTGKIETILFNNGVSTTYEYDPLSDRLNSLKTINADLFGLLDFEYGYTPSGDIQRISDLRNGTTYNYEYDSFHRLRKESTTGNQPPMENSNGIYVMSYPKDNQATTGPGYTPHAVARVLAIGNQTAETLTYDYDSNGNLVKGPDFSNPGHNRFIIYNFDNMPTEIRQDSENGDLLASFRYDGFNTRAVKTSGSGVSTYYVSELYEVKGGEAVKYIFAGNLRIAMVDGNGTSYIHKDHLGSSSVVTRNGSENNDIVLYRPFGLERTAPGLSEGMDYKFTDQEHDKDTGLYNYDARLYDPAVGMFVTADSIVPDYSDPQSLNRYAYCRNNPLLYVDPSGHDSFTSGGDSDGHVTNLGTMTVTAHRDEYRTNPTHGGGGGSHPNASIAPLGILADTAKLESGSGVIGYISEALSALAVPAFIIISGQFMHCTPPIDREKNKQIAMTSSLSDKASEQTEANSGGGETSGSGMDPEEGGSKDEIKNVYNSVKESPNYPKNFTPDKGNTIVDNVKNKELLSKLRQVESGKWQKVYKNGWVGSNRVSMHYFRSQSGKVFDVKQVSGWSTRL